MILGILLGDLGIERIVLITILISITHIMAQCTMVRAMQDQTEDRYIITAEYLVVPPRDLMVTTGDPIAITDL